jgi:hypothetical protein
LNLWSPATGLQACAIRGDAGLTAVAASPDGQRIAAACADGGVRIWATRHFDYPRAAVDSRGERVIELGPPASDPSSPDFGFMREN